MYCPNCGQERGSQATSFCSRCGFLLTGAAELLHTGGVLPNADALREQSPRSKGVKQGLFLFLSTFLVVPLIGLLWVFLFRRPPWPAGVAFFVLGIGGLLRMAYAVMFESRYSQTMLTGSPIPGEAHQPILDQKSTPKELPPQQATPASDYVTPRTGRWLDTNDLEPRSVTESTTRLLERDDHP